MSIKLIQKAWETELKANDLLVLISLADNASDEGYCWPSWKTIILKTKVSKETLRRVLNRLEKAGHIQRESRKRTNGSNASNGYFVLQEVRAKAQNAPIGKGSKCAYQSQPFTPPLEPSREPSIYKPVNIIEYYRGNISNLQSKIKEVKSIHAMVMKKQELGKIMAGLKNYKPPADKKYIPSLLSFIENKIYLDFQKVEKKKVIRYV